MIQLCGRLDGIPLAIELATVQLRTLTLQQLSSRLEHRFSLLTTGRRGALPHQQTLRATTQWSYDLCTAEEQLLWARLSVFAGSFRLTAAEAVCTGGPLAREDILPTLIGLVDKSVVLRTEEDPERYWLLDTIREFGAERLDELPLDADATQDRHIAYFRAMAGEFSRHAKDDDQLPRFRRLRAEHPDLRAALGYALDRPGRAGEAARLAADLRAYWEISGLLREGKHWLTKILLRFSGPSAERAWLLMTRGVLGTLQGELGEAVADLELSIPMAEQHGEVVACALGHAYLCLAFVFSGRHAEAAATGAAALERLQAIDHVSGLVSLDIHMGYLHLLSGEFDLAIERCDQGLRRLGAGDGQHQERWARGYLQTITAMALFFQSKYTESAAAACGSLERKHELGDIVGTAYCLEALGMLAVRQQRASGGLAWGPRRSSGTGPKRLGGTAIMEELHQQAVKAAQDALGEDRYAALFRRRRPPAGPRGQARGDGGRRTAGHAGPPAPGGPAGRPGTADRGAGRRGDVQPRHRAAPRHLQAHRRRAPRAHLRQAGHHLARPARHRAQSGGAVPRSAAASARAAWALTRRPIHQNSTPTTMKHSTGTSSVHR